MNINNGQMIRGCGYCMNHECSDYKRDVFLMGHRGEYRCNRCIQYGHTENEVGSTENDHSLDFYQVRVEFNFDCLNKKYLGVAIVTDETMPKNGNVYTLKSPIIKAEKRALAVAENLLGRLMRADDSIFKKGYILRDSSIDIDFGMPRSLVKTRLDEVEQLLKVSRLVK